MPQSEDRRIRHLTKSVTLSYIPSSEYGKNGDTVFVKSEKSNTIEQFLKQDGKWISLASGIGANDSRRRAGKRGASDASTTTVQNITVNQAESTGTGDGTSTSDHSLLENLDDDDHTQYVHTSTARTVSANHTYSGNPGFSGTPNFSGQPQFTKADGNTPFTVTSTTKVDNLKSSDSDKWDGNLFSSYLDQAVKTSSTPSFTEVTLPQSGFKMKHPSASSYYTILKLGDTELSANRTFSINTGADADISLNVESDSKINQDVTTDGSVIFGNATLSNLAASRLIASNGSKKVVSSDLASWVAGTSNQVSVADDGDGTITLSTPQDIHTSATPTFASATLGTVSAGASAGTLTTTTGDLVLDAYSNTLKLNADVDIESSLDVGTNLNILGNTILGDTTDFSSGSPDTVEMKANVTVKGALTVDGTTTTINSTTLTVDDKNIELGTVDSPSNTTADGGGITLKGATDKTINWINSTGSWTSNQPFEVSNQSSQLKLSYDGSNSSTFGVDSNSILTIGASDVRFNASGQNVDPSATVHTDLGAYNRMWRSLYAAELYVETIVAQDVMATIGGRIVVAPTTKLIADLSSGATTIDVEHNNITNAYIKMQTAPGGVAQIEIMKVASGAPTTITGGYRYGIQRNEDGTGANSWVEGDAVVNLGAAAGEGFIDLTSTTTSLSHLGPNMTIYSRTGTADWDDLEATVSVGNLESWVDYSSDEFGIAIGSNMLNSPNAASNPFHGLTADRTNGLRMFNTPIELYKAGVKKAKFTADGGIKLGDQIDGGGESLKFQWDEVNNELTITGIIHVASGSTGVGDTISDGTTISAGGIYVNSGTGKFTISNSSNDIDYGDASAIFLGLDSSAPKFSLKGAGTQGLTWDGSNLGVTGTVTVQNPEDFAGNSLQEQWAGNALDTNVWTIVKESGHTDPTATVSGGTMQLATNNEKWQGFRSSTTFARANRPVFEWDVTMHQDGNVGIMIGLEDSANQYAGYWGDYLVFFRKISNTDERIRLYYYNGSTYTNNTDLATSSNDSLWVVGDTFRVRWKLLATGCYLEIFKNGNFTSPLYTHTFTSGTATHYHLKMTANDNSTYPDNDLTHNGIVAQGHLPIGTVISGANITTGSIESTNWSSSAGSQMDLDNGTISLGGSSSPKFSVTSAGLMTARSGYIGSASSGWSITDDRLYNGDGATTGTEPSELHLQFNTQNSGSGNIYSWNQKLAGLSATWHKAAHAGHMVFGQVASSGTAIKTNYFGIQMMDYEGREYFCLSANGADDNSGSSGSVYNKIAGWSFDESGIYKDSSGHIGITTSGHSDVGSVPSFFAGATGSTGADSTISFGSDGKIRGSGIYNRDNQDWAIEASRIFGDGGDGDIEIKRKTTSNTNPGFTWKKDGVTQSDVYVNGFITNASGDNLFKVSTYRLVQQRDIYLDTFTADLDVADLHIEPNGFRFFVRDRIILKNGASSGAGALLVFRAHGYNGGAGGNGSPGSNSGSAPVSGGGGGTAGSAGGRHYSNTTTPTPNLLHGTFGETGKDGGDGASAIGFGAGAAADGDPGDGGNPGDAPVSTSNITVLGLSGASGGAGREGKSGSVSSGGDGGSHGSGGSGGAAINASTKMASIDPHLVTTFRDIYTNTDNAERIAPNPGGGSGGSGGGGGAGWDAQEDEYLSGGGGGGSGGSGGGGGIIMVVARLVERSGSNYGKIKFSNHGGNGGAGGDGGLPGQKIE